MKIESGVQQFIDRFIEQERLPSSYRQTVEQFYGPLTLSIRQRIQQHKGVPIIGINGAQGCGKSTVSALIAGLLKLQGIHALVLSIDDLYRTQTERTQLAESVHPLLLTRGVPGTHDMALGQRVIDTVRGIAASPLSEIPRFDKARDDRAAAGTPFPEQVDAILFEGWCIGARPQPNTDLSSPINALEAEYDSNGQWRAFINEKLATDYTALFNQIDLLVMLKPPSFEQVYDWRGEQEAKLRRRLTDSGGDLSATMNSEQLARFIAHYERLTRWMYDEMPKRADKLFLINEEHNVFKRITRARFLVSTDLDATLLDETYSWEAARPALCALAERNDCLVLNSSKTVAEMLELSKELQSECGLPPAPLIAENGCVIARPDAECESGYRIECLGITREEILRVVHDLRDQFDYQFCGFADTTFSEIAKITGLSIDAAERAMNRQATEPILWNGSSEAWEAFVLALSKHSIRAIRGGRFIHLMGPSDKANGLRAALSDCRTNEPNTLWTTVALGDSPNDLEMLNAADIAVVISNPAHNIELQPKAAQVLHPQSCGPTGWNEAMLSLLPSKTIEDSTVYH